MNLNGVWRLGICTDEEYRKLKLEINDLETLEKKGILVVNGTVPGNYELDLEKQHLIENPFFGENLLQERGRERNHLFYGKTFAFHAEDQKEYLLEFEGIDTVAEIYLNGRLLAKADNMFLPQVFLISGNEWKKGTNEILVHILPIAVEARNYDYPLYVDTQKYQMDAMYIRKAAYMFGWDIFPRMLSGGIWKDVRITEKDEIAWKQSYLFTRELSEDLQTCELEYFYELDLDELAYAGLTLEIEGTCGNSHFFEKTDVWGIAGHLRIALENPKLWWPRRTGEQNLYEVEVRLKQEKTLLASRSFRFGVRSVELDRTSLTSEKGEGEFCFLVNHKKIFILGTNWVPLDSFPSRGKDKIKPALDLVLDLDCNMIRCWGGGYYESDEFYEICDEKGILVWQDFMEACGRYPQSEEFLKKLEKEVTFHVRRLRQHPCLALWSGDNENDTAILWGTNGRVDPNSNRNTRRVIPEVLRMNDYVREYLPSSPYIDEVAFKNHAGDSRIPEQHLWGPRDYYKGDFYKNAIAHFASETGYHGCPSVKSIRKFISEKALWPYQLNGEWLLHASSPTEKMEEPYAYRIELMASQIRVLFGCEAKDLEEFSFLSQISQAEAKKYFIERFRIGKWKRTGIIWWNVLDGCPQFSDAVVDYYFDKKLAYDYIKRSQERVVLLCDEPEENGNIHLMASNDLPTGEKIHYCVTDVTCDVVAAEGDAFLPADSCVEIALLDSRKRKAFYKIEWKTEGKRFFNHFVTWKAPFDKVAYLKYAEKAGIIRRE